jgi:hypothetical protein
VKNAAYSGGKRFLNARTVFFEILLYKISKKTVRAFIFPFLGSEAADLWLLTQYSHY